MAGAPQANQSDNSMGILWIVGAILIFSAGIWFAFKKTIVGLYFKLKLLELDLISHFTYSLEDVRTLILSKSPGDFSFHEVQQVGEAVGDLVRYPCIMVIFIFALIVYFTNTTRVYKRTYTMKNLVDLEKHDWPQIVPVADLDLIHTDIDKGPWAMAMTPMQFCKRYHLLDEYRRAPQEGMTRKEWNKVEVTLRRGQANKIFAMQLGSLWHGIEKLPIHTRALFAVFAARYNSDTKPALDLLAQMSASSKGKIDFSGVDELCKKHGDTRGVKKIIASHAYVLTVMASMLEVAREDGVQSSADFLWLKPVDRRLWYMLNSVGRQTPFVEVGGPYAHWLAEKEIGRRLLVPMVEEAGHALGLALKDVVYKPDEPDLHGKD
jgi:intracellular multiplication protein IcmP